MKIATFCLLIRQKVRAENRTYMTDYNDVINKSLITEPSSKSDSKKQTEISFFTSKEDVPIAKYDLNPNYGVNFYSNSKMVLGKKFIENPKYDNKLLELYKVKGVPKETSFINS